MKSSDCMTLDRVQTGYIANVRYVNRYFNSIEINSLELWCKLRKLAVNKVHWRDTMLVIQLCTMCCILKSNFREVFQLDKGCQMG